jgi:hypothetical protein
MDFFYLFLVAGVIIIFIIVQYDKQNKKKVNDILRANKNVPPLFMLRSAELKVNAIRSALNTQDLFDSEKTEIQKVLSHQLDQLIASYTNRQIALSAYYAKLGALLICVNEFKDTRIAVEV